MTPPITGRCLCGRTRFSASQAPFWQMHCHCQSCRRATASGFTSFFGIANEAWTWTGATPANYQSSSGTWRDFCPNCGTPMAYRSTRWPDETHFYAATLDHPENYQPTAHVHTAERLSWIRLNDGLPEHATLSGH
jgi:hypothetical protein